MSLNKDDDFKGLPKHQQMAIKLSKESAGMSIGESLELMGTYLAIMFKLIEDDDKDLIKKREGLVKLALEEVGKETLSILSTKDTLAKGDETYH